MEAMGLNDGLQPPMRDVFTRDLKSWDYKPIVPPVLRTTTLPLPPPSPDNQLPASLPLMTERTGLQECKASTSSTQTISMPPASIAFYGRE